MRDPDIQSLVANTMNGAASEEFLMIKLLGQMLLIMVVGIIIWRIMATFFRRNQQRKPNMFDESRFQKHWRRR